MADPYGILGGALPAACRDGRALAAAAPAGKAPPAAYCDWEALAAALGAALGASAGAPAGGAAGSSAAGGAAAAPGDRCPDCACPLVVRDLSYECPGCQAVFEAADYLDVLPPCRDGGAGSGPLRGRLRLVGVEAPWYQPDLDRTNPAPPAEAQKKSTYQELERANIDYASRGGAPFPKDVLEITAQQYNIVQQYAVRRSQKKRETLAALICHACRDRGFSRAPGDAADLLGLPTRRIADGDSYIRSVDEDHGLGLDLNSSRLGPHAKTALCKLEEDIPPDAAAAALAAAEDLVAVAREQHIGGQSNLRSQVISAIYEVLRRRGTPVKLDVVMARCEIRRPTILRFLKVLDAHHSLIAPVYARHGLDASLHQGARP